MIIVMIRMLSKPTTYLGLTWAGLGIVFLLSCTLVDTVRTDISGEATTAASPRPSSTTIARPSLPTFTPSPTIAVLSSAPTTTPTIAISLLQQGDTLPTPSPSSTPTPVPTLICLVGLNDLNLRQGPGPNYRSMAILPTGISFTALERLADNSWLLVKTDQQERGWVFAGQVTCPAKVTQLPVAAGVMAPTPSALALLPTSLPAATSSSELSPAVTSTPLIPLGRWRGEYFDNPSLLGQPVLVREDTTIEFNWILGSPAPELVPSDDFSIRWTGTFEFRDSGDYRFFAEVDDGIRVYVDDWLVIDAWHTVLPVPYVGEFGNIQAGPHTIVVEYFESGGHAHVKFWNEKTTFADADWRGEYYNNLTWQEPADFIQNSAEIDFNWGHRSPGGQLSSDNFSVRWSRTFFFDAGDYQFFAEIDEDDEIRLTLDGWEIFDKYAEERETIKGFFADLGPGYHTLELEYRDHDGDALVKFWWAED